MPEAARKLHTVSVKLPARLDDRLEEEARRRSTSKSELIRQAVATLIDRPRAAPPASFLARAQDLAGSIDGPEDLSTGPEHLEGYGR